MEMTNSADNEANADEKRRKPTTHPYCRPRDAATLILVDRSAAASRRCWSAQRHDNVVFMPGKFVFPGGRVDTTLTTRFPLAAPITKRA